MYGSLFWQHLYTGVKKTWHINYHWMKNLIDAFFKPAWLTYFLQPRVIICYYRTSLFYFCTTAFWHCLVSGQFILGWYTLSIMCSVLGVGNGRRMEGWWCGSFYWWRAKSQTTEGGHGGCGWPGGSCCSVCGQVHWNTFLVFWFYLPFHICKIRTRYFFPLLV